MRMGLSNACALLQSQFAHRVGGVRHSKPLCPQRGRSICLQRNNDIIFLSFQAENSGPGSSSQHRRRENFGVRRTFPNSKLCNKYYRNLPSLRTIKARYTLRIGKAGKIQHISGELGKLSRRASEEPPHVRDEYEHRFRLLLYCKFACENCSLRKGLRGAKHHICPREEADRNPRAAWDGLRIAGEGPWEHCFRMRLCKKAGSYDRGNPFRRSGGTNFLSLTFSLQRMRHHNVVIASRGNEYGSFSKEERQ